MARLRAGSASSSTSRSASARWSAGGTTKPVLPSSTVSGAPPERPTTTGSPQAAASTAANPRPSGFSPASRVRTGSAKTSARCSSATTPVRGSAPVNRTQPVSPRDRTSCSSRRRCGPSPTRTSSGAGPDPASRSTTSRQARSRVAKPFWATNRPTATARAGPSSFRGGPGRNSVGVHRGGQPEQPGAGPRTERGGDPPLGVVGDDGEVVAATRRSGAAATRAAGSAGPPGLVSMGQADDPPHPGRRSWGASRPSGAAAPKTTRVAP